MIPVLLACTVSAGQGASPRGHAVLPTGRVLQVEIRTSPQERALGYMYRDRVGEDEGMVFIMESLGFHSFWMKNCKVSLDIIWMDESWKVVHLERSLPPCQADFCPNYAPMQASLYALEVQAGLAQKEGIKLGDQVLFFPPAAGQQAP